MQRVLSFVRRACDEYNLIEDGDKIAIGVSGGKDSLALLKAMALFSRFSPKKFTVVGISIDMFNGKTDFSQIEKLCKELNCEYHVVKSQIYDIVFQERKETNPCSLCSKLRRGMLNTKALELGCNKLALGHTADDLIHTYLLSLFYEGRMNTFLPKTYLDRTGMTVIRPLILTDEKLIISVAKNLPVTESKCPADKHTKRELIKDILKNIQKDIPIAKDRLFTALIHPERYNLLDKAYLNKEYLNSKKTPNK